MANKQFNTHCRILDYLDSVEPDLARIIRGVCVDMSLTSLRGKPGITFLMPVDPKFRKRLEELAYSDKPEDANKASDMLNNLIIKDVFKQAGDWKSRQVANSLVPSQVIDVDSTTKNEVVFKSGAKAVIDDRFIDSSKDRRLAVWKLSGEIPITTDKIAKELPKKKKGVVGAYEPGNLQSQSERFKIALAVENSYALRRLQQDNSGEKQCDVYLETVLSLVHYIKNVRKDEALLHDKVLPILSLDKADFYFLVEPHRASGDYLLDNSLISEWWACRGQSYMNPIDIRKDIDAMLSGSTGAAIYSQKSQLMDKIADIRQQISQRAAARPRSSADEIEAIYSELEKSNSIGGIGNVFPADLAQYYANNPGLKMLQDELRYLTYGAFKQLESRGFDVNSFHDLTNMIGEYLYSSTADERARSQKLLNKNTLKYMIAPTEKAQEIQIFVNSTMFMYIPLTSAEASNLKVKNSVSRPDPSHIVLFNIAKDLYKQHERVLKAGVNNSAILDALKSVGLDKKDPAIWDEMVKKFGK